MSDLFNLQTLMDEAMRLLNENIEEMGEEMEKWRPVVEDLVRNLSALGNLDKKTQANIKQINQIFGDVEGLAVRMRKNVKRAVERAFSEMQESEDSEDEAKGKAKKAKAIKKRKAHDEEQEAAMLMLLPPKRKRDDSPPPKGGMGGSGISVK